MARVDIPEGDLADKHRLIDLQPATGQKVVY